MTTIEHQKQFAIQKVEDVTPAMVLDMINDPSNMWIEVILREYGKANQDDPNEYVWILPNGDNRTPQMFFLATTCGPSPENPSHLRKVRRPEYVRETMLSRNSDGQYVFIDRIVAVLRKKIERMIADKKLVPQSLPQ
jgi:hypothetical protein